jgi:protochlorophyllide reductase
MVCDLSDLNSVRTFAKQMQRQSNRLDVLCLNAGIAPSTSPTTHQPRLTQQGFEECIGVNHLGHFLLANLLYPKLKADGGGRLVITASSVHDPEGGGGKSGGKGATLGNLQGLGVRLDITPENNKPTMVDGAVEYSGGKVYKDSKLCNVLFCREAVHRFPGISVRSFNPGFIPETGLFQSLRETNPWKAQALTFFARIIGFSIPVEVGGDRLVYMATTESDNVIPSGSYFSAPTKSRAVRKEDGFQQTTVSKEASDDNLASRLWDKSAEVVRGWLGES